MNHRLSTLFAYLLCSLGAGAAQAALTTPILEYTLNTADDTTALPSGAAVINSGSAGAPGNLTMFGPGNPGTSTNLFSTDGGGVSGLLGDRSLNNTVSTAMGNQGTTYASPNRGPRATNDADNGILNGRTALTITGWVKTEAGQTWRGLSQVWAGDAGSFMNVRSDSAGGKIEFEFTTTAGLARIRSDNADWTAQNAWMFFAVTWDGTNGAVSMYSKDGLNQIQASPATYFSGSAAVQGTGAIFDSTQTAGTPLATYGLALGNQGGYALRPFDGWIDNVRVFDSVLNAADLQSIVNSDLQNVPVPEPQAVTLIVVAAGAMQCGLLRRSRRRAQSAAK